jgi:cytochrome c biogenesis protein CcmG/thiol:disulfide interchange protein DsbE
MPDLTGADPRLARLADEADDLLPGGRAAYLARIRSLRGLPVVANKWASWCDPCRDEAPLLQRAARELGARVAFLGVNVYDAQGASERFRKKFPMSFPSYADPKWKIAALLPPPDSQPVTGIYDARGKLVHLQIGAYTSVAALRADLVRYADLEIAVPTK